MNKKQIVSIIEFIFIGVILLYVTSAFHEYVHLKVLHLLGGDGYIVYPLETIITFPSSNDMLMAFSGGLVTAGVLIVFFVLALKHDYIELASALLTHFFVQVGYGIYEGFYWQVPNPEYMIWGRLVALVSLTIGLIVSLFMLYEWRLRLE